PLNCGVKPQWLAVFTISMGLPAKSLQRFTFCEECSLRNSWSRKAGQAPALSWAVASGTADGAAAATTTRAARAAETAFMDGSLREAGRHCSAGGGSDAVEQQVDGPEELHAPGVQVRNAAREAPGRNGRQHLDQYNVFFLVDPHDGCEPTGYRADLRLR